MLASSAELFSQIAQKVSNKQYYQELVRYQHQFFDLQPYKIDKLYAETAKKIYKQILAKYSYTRELTVDSNNWYQNQRKLFIWFIVCYLYENRPQNPDIDAIDWKVLSDAFFSKNSNFLKFQFLNIIKNKKKLNWTQNQDQLLSKITNQLGPGKWNDISKLMFYESNGSVFRTPKHCRERWLNHLDQNKNKGKWELQQDFMICQYVLQNGKRWSKLVPLLDNKRTEHMIKNRFNSLLTKKKTNKKQKEEQIIKKILNNIQQSMHSRKEGPQNFQDFCGKSSGSQQQLKQLKQQNKNINLKYSAESLQGCSFYPLKKLSFQTSIFDQNFKNLPEQGFYMPPFEESIKNCHPFINSLFNKNDQIYQRKEQYLFQNCSNYSSLIATREIDIEQGCSIQSASLGQIQTYKNKKQEINEAILNNPTQRKQDDKNVLMRPKLSPVYIIKGKINNVI